MRPLFVQRIDAGARASAPLVLTIVVVIINVVPLHLPAYSAIAPDFVLMALFYWTVHRPDLMRPWGAFLVGVLDDILTGTPLGVNALVLLIVHWMIINQHKSFRSLAFGPLWGGFAVIAFGAKLMLTVLALVLSRALIDPMVMLAQLAFTVALYPLISMVMGRAQRAFLPAV